MAAKTKTASKSATKTPAAKASRKASTKTTTRAESAKKTAEETIDTAVDTATTQFEAVATKAQEQYFSLLEQGQTLAIDGIGSLAGSYNEFVTRVQIPAIPGVSSEPRNLPTISAPTDMVDSYFEFAAKALENQREFANRALAAVSKN
jgi:hypothetical protein